MEEDIRTIELKVAGMTCAMCVKTPEAGADAFDALKISPTKNHISYQRRLI